MNAAINPAHELTLTDAMDLHRTLVETLLEGWRTSPARPYASPQQTAATLNLQLPSVGKAPEQLAEELAMVLSMTPATATTRFFNQLFGGVDAAAVLGDMLAPVLNNSLYTWKLAGPHVLIEEALVQHMAQFAGLNGGEGTFTPGGSLSNLTALIIARNEAVPQWRDDGACAAPCRVYTSEDAHYSIRKAVGVIGIGRNNVVPVATDAHGRMNAAALDEAIRSDVARGCVPMCICATSGSTVQGAFDPLHAIADVAAKHNVWLHVDGAFGASLLLSREHRHLLDGVERADSLTWDAHKMMGVPLTCSVVLLRNAGLLQRHLGEQASYLYQGDDDQFNPGLRSLQCGRRNDLLKLWTAWQHHGDSGYEARIDQMMALARHATDRIEQDPRLRLGHRPQSVNVCFEVVDKSSSAICTELHRRGQLLVGTGIVKGRNTIRMVCVNAAMQTADIDAFFDMVLEVAASLPTGDNALSPQPR